MPIEKTSKRTPKPFYKQNTVEVKFPDGTTRRVNKHDAEKLKEKLKSPKFQARFGKNGNKVVAGGKSVSKSEAQKIVDGIMKDAKAEAQKIVEAAKKAADDIVKAAKGPATDDK